MVSSFSRCLGLPGRRSFLVLVVPGGDLRLRGRRIEELECCLLYTSAGTPIPVSRTSRDVIYETTLQAAAAGTVAGSRLVVKSGGTQVGAGDGTFEVVSLDGTTAGSIVRGRFVDPKPAAGGGG